MAGGLSPRIVITATDARILSNASSKPDELLNFRLGIFVDRLFGAQTGQSDLKHGGLQGSESVSPRHPPLIPLPDPIPLKIRLPISSYWLAHSTPRPQFNYLAVKFPDFETHYPGKAADLEKLTYLNFGTVAALNIIAATNVPEIPELTGGPAHVAGWLGQPTRALYRPALQAPDLRSEVERTANIGSEWTGQDTIFSGSLDAFLVHSATHRSGSSAFNLKIQSKPYAIPAGDLIVQFDIKADPLEFYPASVPRHVFCNATGIHKDPYDQRGYREQALAGSAGFSHVVFYFREAGPATARIELEVQGPQDVQIKNFRIGHAADVLAREFEHGLVLCNPSLQPAEFDLITLCPGRQFEGAAGRVTVAPFSARFLVKQAALGVNRP